MEKEGQPCKGHDHAVREGRPRHQGRPRQTRKRILGHVCVRVQPNRLRIDYAMVQATDQATLLRWRHLRTCYRLPGSYPLTCAEMSPPEESCLVSRLNHSIIDPEPVWLYSDANMSQDSFACLAWATLMTRSAFTD